MKTYKYIDETNQVVHVIDEDGKSRMSCLASVLEEGTEIGPADPIPGPTYAELRAAEYPSIHDQLDLIYHSGIAEWKTEIKKTKDKYQKP